MKCKPSTGTTGSYRPFTVCLFNGVQLSYDGTGFTATEPTIPDGVVSKVVVKNGCITQYTGDRDPVYSPPTCVPSPEPCCSDSTSSAVTISKSPGNTLQVKLDGLYASTRLNNGDGVSISGTGTTVDPYVVSIDFTGVTLPSVQSGDVTSVTVSEEDNSVYRVNLPDKFTATQEHLGFSVNQKGVVTSIDDSVVVITNIVGTLPVVATTEDSGVVRVGLKVVDGVVGTYNLGAYQVQLSDSGVVSGVNRDIDLPTGRHIISQGMKYSVNEYGSISSISTATTADVVYDNYATVLSPTMGSATTREFSVTLVTTGIYMIEVQGYFGTSTAQKPLISTTFTIGEVSGATQACFVQGDSQQITSITATGLALSAGVNNFIISAESADMNQRPLLVKIFLAGTL